MGHRQKADQSHNPATFLRCVAIGVVLVGMVGLAQTEPHSFPGAPVAKAALANPSPYSQNSPHWSHINVLDFGRAIQWLPFGATRTAGYEWYARHVDAMETISDRFYSQYASTASNLVHDLNPSLRTFTYDIDLSMCEHMNCNHNDVPNSAQANLPEDQYLHYSQDTQVRYIGFDGVTEVLTETVPGCPSPGPLTAACRVRSYVWQDFRWIANLKNDVWQEWFADHLISEMELNSAGQPNPVDALFLDEHAAGFSLTFSIGRNTQILSGGGIREYGGVAPRNYVTSGYYNFDVLDSAYNADVVTWLGYLQARVAAVGKDIRPNLAGYFMQAMGFQQSLAAKGVMMEHLHAADEFLGANQYQQFLTQVDQLADAGGSIDLAGTSCDQTPAGYTAGNYPTAVERFRMWNLASYYLAKESPAATGTVYFNPNLCIRHESVTPLSFQDEWLVAYEQNVGLPTAIRSVIKQGPLACDGQGYKIFSRQLEHALVLVRPRDGVTCTEYGDPSAVSVQLSGAMQMLQPDGTLSAPMTSVTLRNAEAAILLPAIDTIAPAAVSDLVAH